MGALMQMNATYEGALKALRKAGVVMVDVDFSEVEAYKDENVPGELPFPQGTKASCRNSAERQ